MVIDQEPLRQEASAAYRAIQAKLEKARAEWTRFTEEDQPAYARWLSATFGTLLTRSRELKEALRTKLMLLEEVESEHRFRGGSRHGAYTAVQQRRENLAARQQERAAEEEPEEAEPEQDDREWLFEEFVRDYFGVGAGELPKAHYEALRAEFDRSMSEEDAAEEHAGEEHERSASRGEPAHREPSRVAERIKEKYRWLVRQLHPDTRKEKRPDLLALWHEVQQAYLDRDLERLETLVSLVEMREGRMGEQTTMFQARSALREMKSALRALTRSLKEARVEIMWRFSLATESEREQLRSRVGMELRAEIECIGNDLARVEKTLRIWAEPPPERTVHVSRRVRVASRGQSGFEF